MKRLLRRRTTASDGVPSPAGSSGYHLAALRMQLLVAMAASDGRVLPVEVDKAARVIDDTKLDEESMARLEQLLRIMLDSPPTIDQVIERIKEQSPSRTVAEALVRDLVYMGRLDDVIDEREEAMLRLVCGAFGLTPTTLHRDQRSMPLTASERVQLAELLAAVNAD